MGSFEEAIVMSQNMGRKPQVLEAGKTATLDPYPSDPNRLLAANTKFKVTVTSGATNLAGLSMSSPKSWAFTTGSR